MSSWTYLTVVYIDACTVVYYRVYIPDGAIPAKTAYDPRNPFLGRIAATSVPPPHNAKTLKRCFVNAEKIADPDGSRTVLYSNPDAPHQLYPANQVAIVDPKITPAGVVPDSVFALVFVGDLTVDENAAISRMDLSWCEEQPKYLYYRLFTQTAQDRSNVSFNLRQPALGRIEKILISPPHGVASIKRHIAKVESNPIYADSEFYTDILAQQALADTTYLSVMGDNSVGSTEEEPIVLVQAECRPDPPVHVGRRLSRHRAPAASSSTPDDDDASPAPTPLSPPPPDASNAHAGSAFAGGSRVAYDPRDLLLEAGEDARVGGKLPKLTLMEEVLLLGIKDKQGYLSF
ncbi:hypothetical protein B0H12DRAFT_1231784 [Mycena haematopus]|nr:hypothetical protein B0H12DRAFT_1231784 [Mycena haematopus]